jgi:hypothetical protein
LVDQVNLVSFGVFIRWDFVYFRNKIMEPRYKRRRIEYPRLTDISIISRETERQGLHLQGLLLRQMRTRKRPILVSLILETERWTLVSRQLGLKLESPLLREFYLDDKTCGKSKVLEQVYEMKTEERGGTMDNYIFIDVNQDLVMISDREKLYLYDKRTWECVVERKFDWYYKPCLLVGAAMLSSGDLVVTYDFCTHSIEPRDHFRNEFLGILILDPMTMYLKYSVHEYRSYKHIRAFHTAQHEGFLLFGPKHDIIIYKFNKGSRCKYWRRVFRVDPARRIHDCMLFDEKHIIVSFRDATRMFEIETAKCIGVFLHSGIFQRDQDSAGGELNTGIFQRNRDSAGGELNTGSCNISRLSNGYIVLQGKDRFSFWNFTTHIYTHAMHAPIHIAKEIPGNKLLVCSDAKHIIIDADKPTIIDEFALPAHYPKMTRCQSIVLNRIV